MAIGHRIRFERAKLGYTQLELAERTGIERSKIAKIENGVRNVQSDEAALIAEALRLDPAELLAPAEITRMRVNPEQPASERAIEWFERCIDNSVFLGEVANGR
jgi:transcriptional regulator with XRE-family HTH domain